MDRIKSAWEIALERAKKIEISSEEIQKQLEEKCNAIGKAIAEKFLSSFDLRDLKNILEKYSEKESKLVQGAIISELIGFLELGDYEKMEKVIEGISFLTGKEKIKEVKGKFYVLFDSYNSIKEKKLKEVETRGEKYLEQMGISGDAIKAINLIRSGKELELKKIFEPFEKEFEQYKQELLYYKF